VDPPEDVDPAEVDGEELTAGDELWVTGVEATDELATDELEFDADVFVVVFFGFFGFGGGACSAGTAPALVNGVIVAC